MKMRKVKEYDKGIRKGKKKKKRKFERKMNRNDCRVVPRKI